MEDHHVDRLGVEAWQHVELTSTNSSIGFIALISQCSSEGELTKGNPDHSESHPGGFGGADVSQNILRLPGDYSGVPPLDPIPNSTVKRSSADGTTTVGE